MRYKKMIKLIGYVWYEGEEESHIVVREETTDEQFEKDLVECRNVAQYEHDNLPSIYDAVIRKLEKKGYYCEPFFDKFVEKYFIEDENVDKRTETCKFEKLK